MKHVIALCCLLTAASVSASDGGLTMALYRRLTVWTTPSGRTVEVGHCRGAVNGCMARIQIWSEWIEDAATHYGVDKWTLAAMALVESGMNPNAVGSIGERGIMQLHPRGPGRHIRYVTSERYRNTCMHRVGMCQQEVIEKAAETLSKGIRVCGSIHDGLGYYNSGKCQDTAYAKRVISQAMRLQDG